MCKCNYFVLVTNVLSFVLLLYAPFIFEFFEFLVSCSRLASTFAVDAIVCCR